MYPGPGASRPTGRSCDVPGTEKNMWRGAVCCTVASDRLLYRQVMAPQPQ